LGANFSGLTALVTGGSRGMGKEWARLLLRDGVHVIIWGRDIDELEKTKDELKSEYVEAEIDINSVDIGDRSQIENALKQLSKNHQIDILINNAGTVSRGFFNQIGIDKGIETVNVNLIGPIIITYFVLQHMISRNFGYIVNVSSLAGFLGVPKMATYSASKWGILGFSEAIRLELSDLGKNGINVMTFCPSFVQTQLFAGARPPFLTKWLKPDETVRKAYQALKDGKNVLIDPEVGRLIPPIKSLLPELLKNYIWRILGVNRSSGV
jgi:all-trans-retinol dehydrogenase (NAD+)